MSPPAVIVGMSNPYPAFEKSRVAVFKKPFLIQDLVDFLQREIGAERGRSQPGEAPLLGLLIRRRSLGSLGRGP